jgi:hypothetical protein
VTVAPDGGALSYRLEPGGVLEVAVLPVDATVTLAPPSAGGRAVAVAVGNEGRPAPPGPLTASAREAELLRGIPTPLAPAAAFWLEQSRGSGAAVRMTEEDIRRLESLGYVQR